MEDSKTNGCRTNYDDLDEKLGCLGQCVFCRIGSYEEGVKGVIFKDENVVIFEDHRPKGEKHLQVVPLRHIQNIFECKSQDLDLIKEMKETALKLLQEMGFKKKEVVLGFHRPPFNSVQHLHMHAVGNPYSDKMYLTFGTWMIKTDKAIKYLSEFGSVKKGALKATSRNKYTKHFGPKASKKKESALKVKTFSLFGEDSYI
ncbi:unnamed protein product [Moneuplotes crassus]|uniref:HIT domain-containing protein n=1 Tax=Euplotes crassus TaxID=5936 RepID=A0AAD2D4S7_EUPCR|nr:unnamed protein product [Moneuplotes crassus]